MFEKQQFIKSVYNIEDLPKQRLPEVILCGRSNVGKSSFINSIFNRKNLAKISSTPGKTRSINYYQIDERFYMVDLPGYGYAKTSLKEREYWGKFVSEFIVKSGHISLAIHLIDSRHNPTALDAGLNYMFKTSRIPYLIILNKIDKLNHSETSRAKRNIFEYFPELKQGENLFLHSSVKKTGRKEILSHLSKLFYSDISLKTAK
jgi:GTP-binding protein